jgi:hypothetical protein
LAWPIPARTPAWRLQGGRDMSRRVLRTPRRDKAAGRPPKRASERLVLGSALLALLSFALMGFAVVSPGAQEIAAWVAVLSLFLYGWATLRDLRKVTLGGQDDLVTARPGANGSPLGGVNATETRGS